MPGNCALYLSDFRWNWPHVHFLEFLDWRERIQEFGDEGIKELLAVFG